MRETVSTAPRSVSVQLLVGFVVLNVLLLWLGFLVAFQSLGGHSQAVIGVTIGLGFGTLAVSVLVVFRFLHPHRFVLEAEGGESGD